MIWIVLKRVLQISVVLFSYDTVKNVHTNHDMF